MKKGANPADTSKVYNLAAEDHQSVPTSLVNAPMYNIATDTFEEQNSTLKAYNEQ